MIKRSARETFIKTKKLCNIYDIDVDKLLISKKEPYGEKVHLNIFLDSMMMMMMMMMMIMMLLGLYV